MRAHLKIIIGTALGCIGSLAVPAAAQTGEKVLVIYGTDRCPTASNGDEIVVCSRRPESERYRIPQNLRDTGQAGNERWADRARSLTPAGAAGIGSCSPVGPGGASGCFKQSVREDRAEQNRKAEAEPDLPNR